MKTKKSLLAILSFSLVLASFTPLVLSQTQMQAGILDPLAIPKWVNQLENPIPVFEPTNFTDGSGKLVRQDYTVRISQFNEQALPTVDERGNPTGYPTTKVWGYESQAKDWTTQKDLGVIKSSPGFTFEAIKDVPVHVKWVNNLVDAQGQPLPHLFAIDPTIHWANPKNIDMPMDLSTVPSFPPGFAEAQSPVPIVMHLHGGEVASSSDGHPEAWTTPDGLHGPAYNTAEPTDANAAAYVYPNSQQSAALWYHDHTLGITNLNVLAGLAGFYLIRNPSDPTEQLLPSGEYEMPLIIQDKTFLTDGSLYVPIQENNSNGHPYWNHYFLGNTISVNGKVWPNMNVKQGEYRLRILDASSSRSYRISFSNGLPFTLIGTDGGFSKTQVPVSSLTISPAERVDILVDFSNVLAGQKVVLRNDLVDANETQTLGQIIQFTVLNEKGFTPNTLPKQLNPTLADSFPSLPNPTKQRTLTLTHVGDPFNPSALLLDGQKWSAPISEKVQLGTTEDWTIVNPTVDAHPIHLHLVQFQLVSRQKLNSSAYMRDWTAINGEPPLNHSTVNLASLEPYLIGSPLKPLSTEQGWKDTINVNNDEVVIIRVRFAEQDGSSYGFDATAGPGYVWHCHLLPHEDNQMMRPYIVVAQETSVWLIPLVAVIVVAAAILGTVGYRYRKKAPKNKL